MELLLADALGVAGQDLVLDLVDGAGDGGQQLLPAHADVLQGGGGGGSDRKFREDSTGRKGKWRRLHPEEVRAGGESWRGLVFRFFQHGGCYLME